MIDFLLCLLIRGSQVRALEEERNNPIYLFRLGFFVYFKKSEGVQELNINIIWYCIRFILHAENTDLRRAFWLSMYENCLLLIEKLPAVFYLVLYYLLHAENADLRRVFFGCQCVKIVYCLLKNLLFLSWYCIIYCTRENTDLRRVFLLLIRENCLLLIEKSTVSQLV